MLVPTGLRILGQARIRSGIWGSRCSGSFSGPKDPLIKLRLEIMASMWLKMSDRQRKAIGLVEGDDILIQDLDALVRNVMKKRGLTEGGDTPPHCTRIKAMNQVEILTPMKQVSNYEEFVSLVATIDQKLGQSGDQDQGVSLEDLSPLDQHSYNILCQVLDKHFNDKIRDIEQK